MKKTLLVVIGIVLLLLIALTQSHDYQYIEDLKESTHIERNINNMTCDHMSDEMEIVDYYYRTHLNGNIPVFVNIYDGEIMLLSETQANTTDRGAVYDIDFNKVYDIEPDMDSIVHTLNWIEKRIQDI